MDDGHNVDRPEHSAPLQVKNDLDDEVLTPGILLGKHQEQGSLAGPAKTATENEHVSALREWIGFVARVGFWALLLYLFVFQVSVVEGPSMEPTFYTNDRLVIDKLTYRFTSIRRFDVVVFQAIDMHPYRVTRDSKDYIKRVIGLPGEKIVLKQHQVFVDGKLLEEPTGLEKHYLGSDEFSVPPHYYFVMGDNRGDSKDSRSPEMGFIPEAQIRGLVRLRFAPLSRWTWFGRY